MSNREQVPMPSQSGWAKRLGAELHGGPKAEHVSEGVRLAEHPSVQYRGHCSCGWTCRPCAEDEAERRLVDHVLPFTRRALLSQEVQVRSGRAPRGR
jgi:hypothetical protein